MDKKRFFIVLDRMLDSGEFKEDVFADVLDDLDIPYAYLAKLPEAKTNEILDTEMQLHYINCIAKGVFEPMCDKKPLISYLKKALEFRWEFYKRSNVRDDVRLDTYKLCCSELFLEKFFEEDDDYLEELPFQFDTRLPIEENLKRLKEFQRNAELVIKHYVADGEEHDVLVPSSLVKYGLINLGKEEGQKRQFKLWERYLRVWELNKERNGVIEKDDNRKIDGIAKIIVKEFDLSTKTKPSDRRKTIKDDYNHALELISKAENGTFFG